MTHEATPDDLPVALAAMPPRHRRVAAGLAVILVVWSALNLLYSLDDHPLYPSESKFADTTQQLLNNESPQLDYPQLVHQPQSFAIKLLGPTPRALRLPSVLAALLAAVAAYLLGSSMRDPTLGLIAAGLTLTFPPWVAASRLATPDILFAAVFTIFLVLLWLFLNRRAKPHPIAFLAAIIVLLMLIFFIAPDKSLINLAPLGPPLALIAAWYLRRWLDIATPGRIPYTFLAVAILATAVLIAATVAAAVPTWRDKLNIAPAMSPILLKLGLQSMLIPALFWTAFVMSRRLEHRAWSLLVFGAALTTAVSFGLVIENALTIPPAAATPSPP